MRSVKKICGILFVFLFLAQPCLAQLNTDRFCEKKWPANYSMQEFCIKEQKEAHLKFLRWGVAVGIFEQDTNGDVIVKKSLKTTFEKDMYAIGNMCLGKWHDETIKSYNMSMVWFCIEEQYGAYKRLKK